MIRLLRNIFGVIGLVLCIGCVARQQAQNYSIEVITPEDKALAAVEASPVEFKVPIEQEGYAWERAKIFFQQYQADRAPKTKALSHGGLRLYGRYPDRHSYTYQVEKYPSRTGAMFFVKCTPRGSTATRSIANRNSKNLARFIREGKLEVSLLVR
ncbi:hypothetical protein OAO01_05095 [Oligoflexia bacterium]|nr:hypothetical protein [Oligoflexia bacterium]